MNTQKEKERICRLERILDIIQTAESCIDVAKKHLKFQNCFTNPHRLHKEINTHYAAIERLTNYYNATLAK